MPKSKREKLLSLTQTAKKGKEGKEALFRNVRAAIDTYRYTWVFSVDNMRNTYLKDVRARWSDSRILLGRSKVIAKAIGITPAEAYSDGIEGLQKSITGTVGLLCTSHAPEIVKDWFADYAKHDFARAGTISPVHIKVPAGQVYTTIGTMAKEDDVLLSHTMEPVLRALGSISIPCL